MIYMTCELRDGSIHMLEYSTCREAQMEIAFAVARVSTHA
jgi:hypothetical protein